MGFTSAVLTPDTTVTGLSGGERQGCAIVRALHFEAEIIILDEPTMGLSLKETEKLLDVRRRHPGRRQVGASSSTTTSSTCTRSPTGSSSSTAARVAGEFPTSRYSLEELMGIMREVAVRGAFTEAERYRPDLRRHSTRSGRPPQVRSRERGRDARRRCPSGPGCPAGRPPGRPRSGSRRRSSLLWLTFIVLAPGTFLSENIYLSFAQTTPFFALVAMPLTMVIIAGDIDLSFPSVMALGMVGFVFVWQATGSVAPRGGRAARGRRAGRPVQRPDHHLRRDPVARRRRSAPSSSSGA